LAASRNLSRAAGFRLIEMKILRALLLVPALLAVLTASALAKSPPTQPSGARVDPSYGLDGSYAVATTKPEQYEAQGTHLALAKDGEAYVLQGTAVTAFTPAGKPDHDFARNGRLRVELGPGQLKTVAAVAVDSQGRVLVAGTYEPFPGYYNKVIKGTPGHPIQDPVTEAFVARYLPDGSLDTSFGSGGVEITTLGVPRPTDMPAFETPGTAEYERASVAVTSLLVDSQDRPVIAGEYVDAIEGCAYPGSFPQSFVGRLTAAGAVDSSFAGTGYTKTPGGATTSLASGPGGELVATSHAVYPCAEHGKDGPLVTSVLTEAGEPSPALDPARPSISGGDLSIDGNGRLLFANWQMRTPPEKHGWTKILRVLPDGNLDTVFGYDGAASLKQFGVESLGAMTVDAKNRPVVVFGSERPELVRFTTAGKVDHTFAKKGVLRAKVQRAEKTIPDSIAIDSKGRIVVAGKAEGGSLKGGFGIAVTRFLPGK
jgi:uncharacterized delta-60 repeat protein